VQWRFFANHAAGGLWVFASNGTELVFVGWMSLTMRPEIPKYNKEDENSEHHTEGTVVETCYYSNTKKY
jgi:hypothetical protein